MAVFETFARERRELSNSEIARLLDLADSSSSDLLHTLHELGYLMRTATTRRFYPTPRLHSITTRIADHDPFSRAGIEAAEFLVERTGETAFFGRLENGAVKVLAVQEGKHPLRYILNIGERIALHASALGKAILGALPEQEAARQLRLKPLRPVTPHTVVDLSDITRQVAESRQRGWYEVRSEGSEGVVALAVSGVIGGEVVAVSIAGPTERVDRNRESYLKALIEVGAASFKTF